MKASELIKTLETLKNKYGDLDLVYSVDEEGNYFNHIAFDAYAGYYDSGEFTPVGGDDWDEDLNINAICVN
jgi:hypothetical protein